MITFPVAWQNLRLKRLVADLRNGVWGDEPINDTDSVYCIRAADFDREHGLIATDTLVRRNISTHDLQANRLSVGDLVLEKSGGGQNQPVGMAVWFDLSIDAVPTNFAARVRSAAIVDSRYLYYVFAAIYSLGLNWRSIKQTTGIQNLDTDALLNERWAIPPVEDQLRVASLLDRETLRIESLIAKKTLLRRRLEERRWSVIFAAVCGVGNDGVLTHDVGIAWANEIRHPWRKVKIKHVARLGTGHTPSRSHPEYWENCNIPWITTGEIQQVRDDRAEVITDTRERISEIGLANSAAALHPKGTVVLCRTASAGYSAIMGADMATSQDFVTWVCSEKLLPRYLLMCLRAMRPDLLGRLAYGSTHKTIYFPDIENLSIPLPSVQEQEEALAEIDRHLRPIDELTDKLEQQILLLRERKSALITAAVTGELEVPV